MFAFQKLINSGFAFKVKTFVAVQGQRGNFPPFFPSLSTRLKAGELIRLLKLTRFLGGFRPLVKQISTVCGGGEINFFLLTPR